jgi:hypothetical protein
MKSENNCAPIHKKIDLTLKKTQTITKICCSCYVTRHLRFNFVVVNYGLENQYHFYVTNEFIKIWKLDISLWSFI